MKKQLLLLSLFVSLAFYGQNEKTVNLNVKNEYVKNNRGYTYLGNGKYSVEIKVFWGNEKKVIKKLLEKVQTIAKNLDANYKVLNNRTEKETVVSDYRYGVATFKLSTKDGTPLINKDEAKKQILELKEFLDLGIITKEEFVDKTTSLKKILLGN
jgi:hypothetical protein